MKKLTIIVFIFILATNCSTKKEITLRQIGTDRYVVIRADTMRDLATVFSIPLVFEFTNPFPEERSLEHAKYYYHPRYYADSLPVRGLEGWLSNGFHDAELNGTLVRLTRSNRADRRVNNSGKSRNVFCPIISLDTTYTTQSIFKPYVKMIKGQPTDIMSIMNAKKFIKKHPEFCRWMLSGDSICFDVYNANEKYDRIDTVFYLPIRLITR